MNNSTDKTQNTFLNNFIYDNKDKFKICINPPKDLSLYDYYLKLDKQCEKVIKQKK